MEYEEKTKLLKYLGFYDLFFINICDIIGSGFFVLFIYIIMYGGKNTIYAIILIGLSSLITGLVYAEIVSIYKNNSSEFNLINDVFNINYSYIFSYMYIFFNICTITTIIIACSKYIFGNNYIYNISFSIFLTILIYTLIFFGIKLSSYIINIISISILSTLIIIIIFGYINLDKNIVNNNLNTIDTGKFNILICSSLLVFLFSGYDSVTKMYHEINDENKKDIPTIIVLTITISTILYVLLAYLLLNIFNKKNIKNNYSPIYYLYNVFLGKKISSIIYYIGILILFGTSFSLSLTGTRYIYSLSENKILPKYLMELNEYKVPYYIVLYYLLIILILVLFNNVKLLLNLTNIFIFILLLNVNIGIVIYRYYNKNNNDNDDSYKMPLYINNIPILPVINSIILFILLCITLIINTKIQSDDI